MSTISEVDIRDWDKVDFKLIEIADSNASEYEFANAYHFLNEFAEQVKLIRDKQLKSVAALLRRPE